MNGLEAEAFAGISMPLSGGSNDYYGGASLNYAVASNIDLTGGYYNIDGTNRFSLGLRYQLNNNMYLAASYENFSGGGNAVAVEIGGNFGGGDEPTFALKNWAKIGF